MKEAQELGVPIITFWSCTDDGKCEVDGAGKRFAEDHKDVLVPGAVEEAKDAVDCLVLLDKYNELLRNPKHKGKDSPLEYREAFVLDPQDIDDLRASRPLYKTLVLFILFFQKSLQQNINSESRRFTKKTSY